MVVANWKMNVRVNLSAILKVVQHRTTFETEVKATRKLLDPVVNKVVRTSPFLLQTDSHFSLLRKLFEFPSQPLYTNGKHSSRSLLKCHRILKLEQFPSARGSSQKSAVVGMAADE